ncbi:hypothetical protein N9934_02420 [Desulfosarcina sp.]|nr:hypothetical protein [Desulfosarcina sp.]
MRGGIYTNQRCVICGKQLRHFEPNGLWCPNHPQVHATKMVVRFGKITRNFSNYHLAYRKLTGYRYEEDRGTFDVRDHRVDEPLGFENLVKLFIEAKKHIKAIKKYEQRLRFGVDAWHNRNVKLIRYAEIEDLQNALLDSGKSPYYVKRIIDTYKTFWRWLLKRREITADQMPEFPEIKAEPKLRKVLRKDRQQEVLEKIYIDTWEKNPRIYIAVSILATYPKVRPGELIQCKERYFDPEMGRLHIEDPKEGYPKYLPLVEYHVDLLRALPKSFPEMRLFRHSAGNGAAKSNGPFGRDYLANVWRRVCDALGIKDVSLYPGTKHSTVIHWRNECGRSKSECMEGTGHKTNKAFERYYDIRDDTLRALYEEGLGKVIHVDRKARIK